MNVEVMKVAMSGHFVADEATCPKAAFLGNDVVK